jgi:hypothetical protein
VLEHFISHIEFLGIYENMKTILLIALVISANLAITESLRCRCDSPHVKCTPVYKLNCAGGLVRDVCGCCAVCAKVKGEKCGGPWNLRGRCGCGLRCRKSPKVIAQVGEFNAGGICVAR